MILWHTVERVMISSHWVEFFYKKDERYLVQPPKRAYQQEDAAETSLRPCGRGWRQVPQHADVYGRIALNGSFPN